MEMEVDSDCSDSDGHEYDNNQEAIVIPITKRNDTAPAEGFRTDNGVQECCMWQMFCVSGVNEMSRETYEG